jgi:ribosomal silencing factor RsfS
MQRKTPVININSQKEQRETFQNESNNLIETHSQELKTFEEKIIEETKPNAPSLLKIEQANTNDFTIQNLNNQVKYMTSENSKKIYNLEHNNIDDKCQSKNV